MHVVWPVQSEGRTALHVAAWEGNGEAVEALLQEGCDANLAAGVRG